MNSDELSSDNLSHDSWEEETLSKFDIMDGQPISSLPKINYLESARNTSIQSSSNSFIKRSITNNVRDISLDEQKSPLGSKRSNALKRRVSFDLN